jgi:hypothetical protein
MHSSATSAKGKHWPYLTAEIGIEDLASLRLTGSQTENGFLLAMHGDIGLFFRRADVARLIFPGKNEFRRIRRAQPCAGAAIGA